MGILRKAFYTENLLHQVECIPVITDFSTSVPQPIKECISGIYTNMESELIKEPVAKVSDERFEIHQDIDAEKLTLSTSKGTVECLSEKSTSQSGNVAAVDECLMPPSQKRKKNKKKKRVAPESALPPEDVFTTEIAVETAEKSVNGDNSSLATSNSSVSTEVTVIEKELISSEILMSENISRSNSKKTPEHSLSTSASDLQKVKSKEQTNDEPVATNVLENDKIALPGMKLCQEFISAGEGNSLTFDDSGMQWGKRNKLEAGEDFSLLKKAFSSDDLSRTPFAPTRKKRRRVQSLQMAESAVTALLTESVEDAVGVSGESYLESNSGGGNQSQDAIVSGDAEGISTTSADEESSTLTSSTAATTATESSAD